MRKETIFSPQISHLRAWTLLADLNRYEAWHPHYCFGAGVVELGNKIDMTWTLMGTMVVGRASCVKCSTDDQFSRRIYPCV